MRYLGNMHQFAGTATLLLAYVGIYCEIVKTAADLVWTPHDNVADMKLYIVMQKRE